MTHSYYDVRRLSVIVKNHLKTERFYCTLHRVSNVEPGTKPGLVCCIRALSGRLFM